MSRLKAQLMALACVLCVVMAGSKSHPDSASTGSGGSVAASAADPSDTGDVAPLDCNKVFVPGDAAGILTTPAKITNFPNSKRSCWFSTDNGGSIDVFGDDEEATWDDVTLSVDRAKYVDLPGVGDRAERKGSDGTVVVSKKGNVYCRVNLEGLNVRSNYTKTRGEELAKRLGALCNKLFAAK
jgi:hypothetical protein